METVLAFVLTALVYIVTTDSGFFMAQIDVWFPPIEQVAAISLIDEDVKAYLDADPLNGWHMVRQAAQLNMVEGLSPTGR